MITLQKGRYEALEPLGSGATSRVEKARDNVIGRTVALKTFINGFGEGQEQQFLREAQIIGQLSNPAIVQLYDVGIDEQGTPFLVMEYIAGKTLEHHLDPSQLPPQRACAWAADLAGALAIAHRAGILHGDVKPGNILVTPENKVKLGDFGIARFASQVSGSGRLMGTPAYLAPEQIEGRPQDSRSDQFALGIVLYQMLTGARPFDGSSVGAVCAQILNAAPMPPSQRNRAVTPALDRVVARCLAKNPEDRFASCDDLAAALYPLARSQPQPGAPQIRERSWWSKPVRQYDVWIAASACLLLAASIQLPRSLSVRYALSPAPAHPHFLPGVPYEAYGHTPQSVAAAQPDTSDAPAPPSKQKTLAPRINRTARLAASRGKERGDSQSSPSMAALVATPPLPVLNEPATRAALTPGLHIEITSAVTEGTLAIFADHQLLFTTNFVTDKPGQPIHFEHALPAGSHQFRVALYKPDRSLQLEKEGLAEIRSDADNTLAVRVNRHAKLLRRRELALDVVWPGALAPAAGHASTTVKTAAFLK